jgi:hypothetical protein
MKETQITAYALNELQGNERNEFESALAADQKLQGELASASRVADGLAQAMSEPGEGLEPQAREKLLRAIVANQEALRAQRKGVRFAIPISLAAAASIAALLWVTGGMTTHEPAMTAAGALQNKVVPTNQIENFAARIPVEQSVFTFEGSGKLSTNSFALADSKVVSLSENAKAPHQASAQGTMNTSNPGAIRIRSLIWEAPQTLGQGAQGPPNGTEVFAQ